MSWSEVREAGIEPVADAFGLKYKRSGSIRHGLAPCPECGADNRSTEHHHDPHRGPIGLTRDGLGWCCHVCGVRGDAVSLVSYLVGQRGQVNRVVAEECKRKGLLHDGDAPRQPRPSPPPRTPEYLPPDELRKFTNMLVSIDHPEAKDIRAWLMGRKIDPSRMDDLKAIKALPPKAPAPHWAQCQGKPWARVGYRLIAPLYDSNGRMRSFHARAVVRDLNPKGANPASYELGGLLLACPLAQLWLKGANLGDDTTPAKDWIQRVGLIITEGLVDWLFQLATYSDANQDIPATLGIMSGSWTQKFADKIPDKCRVLVVTDRDKAGNEYAAKIGKTLLNRVDIRRWKGTSWETPKT